MRVNRLDHVSLRIADLERSRTFYEGLLGLRTAPRPEIGLPGVWYDVAGAQVHLIQGTGGFDGIDPSGPHFAVQVESLAAVRADLDARGVPYVALGDAQLWIRDPDGNVVELCEPRSG
jgi:catechol 2,3-dioxygenase-like lactoylglutathione lyase family enzyme